MIFTLPENVRTLLQDCLASYEELNILLFLRRESPQAWSAESIGSRLAVPRSLVVVALAELQGNHLIETGTDPAESRYTFAPATPALRDAVGDLSAAYEQHPLEVIKCMSDNAMKRLRLAALRTFADAFVLRKGK